MMGGTQKGKATEYAPTQACVTMVAMHNAIIIL